jgi:hypothetical protein
MNNFIECAECAAKPGQPPLCESCLSNRNEITRLEGHVETLGKQVRDLSQAVELLRRMLSAVIDVAALRWE